MTKAELVKAECKNAMCPASETIVGVFDKKGLKESDLRCPTCCEECEIGE